MENKMVVPSLKQQWDEFYEEHKGYDLSDRELAIAHLGFYAGAVALMQIDKAIMDPSLSQGERDAAMDSIYGELSDHSISAAHNYICLRGEP